MALVINKTKYAKTAYPLRHGYDRRPSGVYPSKVTIHTTNNPRKNTAFTDEAEYLHESAKVSSHFLIGKRVAQGIVQFLPETFRAWHAGDSKPGWGNSETIGIELHVSEGEAPTDYQILTLTELVRSLMRGWGIPPQNVETHRFTAVPKGRKTDPEGWGDEAFYNWRDELVTVLDPWSLWGNDYPLPADQHGFGIPSLWFNHRQQLKQARSFPWYPPGVQGFVAQLFQGGLIWCRDGQCQLEVFTKALP
jgi:hypothetical protein